MKKIAKIIVLVIVALPVLAVTLTLLLFGLEHCGIDLWQANKLPGNFPWWLVGTCIGIILLFAVMKRKAADTLPSTSGESTITAETLNRYFTRWATSLVIFLPVMWVLQLGLLDPSSGVFYLAAIVCCLSGIFLAVFHYLLLYHCWKLIPGDIARTTPAKAVGFCFVPIFNYYWMFVAYNGLGRDMNKTCRQRGISFHVKDNLGWWYCILSLIGYPALVSNFSRLDALVNKPTLSFDETSIAILGIISIVNLIATLTALINIFVFIAFYRSLKNGAVTLLEAPVTSDSSQSYATEIDTKRESPSFAAGMLATIVFSAIFIGAVCLRQSLLNPDAIEEIHKRIEQGDINAQNDLGCCYYYGRGVVKNDEEAVKWLQIAAEQGQVDALYQLGLCYFLGTGVPRNEDEAIRLYWMAMQGGHAGAVFLLHKLELDNSEEYRQLKTQANYGSTHIRNDKPLNIDLPGTGGGSDSSPGRLPRVSRSEILAGFDIMHWNEQWTRISYPTVRPLDSNKTSYYDSERDTIYVSPDCTQFSFDHELGRKLRFDTKREWEEIYKQRRGAAEQGDAEAQILLALCYVYGNGVAHDYSEAAKWFRKSADQGNAAGQYELGVCYRNGGGVPQDDAEAARWMTKAAEQGLDRAQTNLGLYYLNGIGVPKDEQAGIQWLRKSIAKENAQARCILGECYFNGVGVSKDLAKAVELYRQSAEQGYAGAQYNLGICHYNGDGLPKNEEEALKWLRMAAQQGYEPALELFREAEQK